jgi:hypothetical protein
MGELNLENITSLGVLYDEITSGAVYRDVMSGALYNKIMSYHDPRTDGYPLMESPVPHMVVLAFYLFAVAKGPQWMKTRPAFELRTVLVLYNLALVVLSTYMFYEFLAAGWFMNYSWFCQPIDYTDAPLPNRMVRVSWLFFFSKLIELADTIFFILRKKNNQVSFLHVFHHTAMPIAWWWGVRFVCGGSGTFHGMVNSFVHVVMYSYYCLSAFGPGVQKYLFWKKWITKIQISQFLLVLWHTSQLWYYECNYSKVFIYWIGSYTVIFLVMFSKFYIQAYLPQDKKRQAALKLKADSAVANGHSHTNGFSHHNGVEANGKLKAN